MPARHGKPHGNGFDMLVGGAGTDRLTGSWLLG
jgi:hypothetical protein